MRPTPEEIRAMCNDNPSLDYDDELASHGYVIVHPDDVPIKEPSPDDQRTANGWNACRRLVFGDDR